MALQDNEAAAGYQILIVDDEKSVHSMLAAYFTRRKFRIEHAYNGSEALEMLTEFQPDVILLDLMMPVVDGISFTRQLRSMPTSNYIPIIMLTARKNVSDIVTAMDAGADDYVTKPFDFEELNARIRSVIRLKTLQNILYRKSDALDKANQRIQDLNDELQTANKSLQKKIYDFHNLFEVSFQVIGQLEFSELIRQSLIHTLGLFTARSALLLMLAPGGEEVYQVVDARGCDDEVLSLEIERKESLVAYLEKIRKPCRIKEISMVSPFLHDAFTQFNLRVVAPLFQNDELIGLLFLGPNFKGESYRDDSLETLGIMTNMLAVAAQNAQMYEHIKALSYTDGMTNLHNYRFFRMRIKQEVARAKRENTSVSLLIMDVDHFKNYNDTLGHPAGDEVLRKISAILKTSVRDNDIVARYGGEEFAVLLPGADAIGSYALAERIRVAVEKETFFKEELQPMGQVTISVGTGTFPQDGETEDELIVNTDQALYEAKNNGRNKVFAVKNMTEST